MLNPRHTSFKLGLYSEKDLSPLIHFVNRYAFYNLLCGCIFYQNVDLLKSLISKNPHDDFEWIKEHKDYIVFLTVDYPATREIVIDFLASLE